MCPNICDHIKLLLSMYIRMSLLWEFGLPAYIKGDNTPAIFGTILNRSNFNINFKYFLKFIVPNLIFKVFDLNPTTIYMQAT